MSFDKYSNYNDILPFSSVVFGSDKPLLEVELNEMQQIITTKFKRLCKGLDISGYYPSEDGAPIITTTGDNINVSLKTGIIITSKGLIAEIPVNTSVSFSKDLNADIPYIYFEVKEDLNVTKDSVINKYGYLEGGTYPNPIQDSRLPIETTRRKAYSYTLKVGFKKDLIESSVTSYVGVASYINGEIVLEKSGFDKIREEIESVESDIRSEMASKTNTIREEMESKTNTIREEMLYNTNPVFSGSLSMGRANVYPVGNNSVVFGIKNDAGASQSFSHGDSCITSGANSFSSGQGNKATGVNCQSFGNGCTTSGTGAFSCGYNNVSMGVKSFSTGESNRAEGEVSVACGNNNKALTNQFVIGHHNDTSVATENSYGGTSTGSAFIIGNGSPNIKSNAFRVTGEGITYAKGAYNATGADYAEYVEWADGNPNNEDRRGYFVTVDDENPKMMRIANSTDDYILGVVSGNPCILGNSDECWLGKYLFDEFGDYIYETVEEEVEQLVEEEVKSIDPETGETIVETIVKPVVKTISTTRYKLNPDYDDTKEYKQRSERPEWSAVGFIGVLSVRDDGTCEVGGYCTCSDGGIATKAEPSRFNYRVIERLNDHIVKIIVK